MANSSLTQRQNEIIESAIETMGNSDSPFTTEWAEEHHLTTEENAWLFQAVRTGLLLYFRQTPQQQVGAKVVSDSPTSV